MTYSLVIQSLDAYAQRATAYADPRARKSHQYAEKLLRAMIDHAPSADGQDGVAHAITLCVSEDQKLLQLSDYYVNGLIRPMKALGGLTPPVSDHPSRRSAEIQRDINATFIESAKRDHGALKALALRRDRFRCVLSGSCDQGAVYTRPELFVEGRKTEYTQAAHIIPFAINKDKNNNDISTSAAIWEIITMFTGISLHELNGDLINRLENIITLGPTLHVSFGRLEIWLEPIGGQPNAYKFKKFHPFAAPEIPDGTTMTFQTSDARLPLPDPRYLGLHAACAKIAHTSGAAEIIDLYMREMADRKVLAQDGSSMEILEHALSLALIAAH